MTVTVAAFDAAPSLSLTVYVNVSVPIKAESGVYVTVPSALGTALPLVGMVTTFTVVGSTVPSLSVSFAITLIITRDSSSVTAASSRAVGGWLAIALTVTVTVAAFDAAPSLSLTVYVNVSVPIKAESGVYVTVPSALGTALPLVGMVTTFTVVGSTVPSLSVSFAITLIITRDSSSVTAASSRATGLSLSAPSTVILTVAKAVSLSSSVIV